MNAEVLQMISVIAFAMAGILGVTAVILFFRLNVGAILDDLNGKKAERQIRELREQNRKTEINRKERTVYENYSKEGVKIRSGEPDEEKTALLHKEEETSLPDDGRTALLPAEEETVLLCDKETAQQNNYKLLLDEMVIHTKEII